MTYSHLVALLNSVNIRISFAKNSTIYLNPKYNTVLSWPTFQYYLKLVARYNQNGKCLGCEIPITLTGQLHHAIISRGDVRGSNKETKSLIHHSFNVAEICYDCHQKTTKKEMIIELSKIYGAANLIEWYNEFPLTKIFRIESYFNTCLHCDKLISGEYCTSDCKFELSEEEFEILK